jgi:hypothetical protein
LYNDCTMKIPSVIAFVLLACAACKSQERVSPKTFDAITLVNKIEFVDSKYDQPKFSCGFLLAYNKDTFAITARHILKVIKTDDMKVVSLEPAIKSWSLYPLTKPAELVVTDKLVNENKAEPLEAKATYDNDWLLFSIKENHAAVRPLQVRTTPLNPGEKLYVVGWTRKMESGEQRVYEFEYYKTIGNRILLKDLIVPEQFGGLSGAPVVDEQGQVVGLVSNGTVDPATNKKYFSPCAINSVITFLEKRVSGQ